MKEQGFTLIELLAVIVILAIIALIATPIVLNIISNTKENARLRSAEMYLDAVEQSVAIERMNNTNFKPNTCSITSEGNLFCEGYEPKIEVKVNGEKPTDGSITFTEGKITQAELKYENGKTIVMNNKGQLQYKNYVSINNYQHKHIDGTIEDHEVTFDSNGHGKCSKCGVEVLAAGLYDENDVLVASWDELVNTYGLDVSVNYNPGNYSTSASSPYYIIKNNSELSNGVKIVIGDVTSIGKYAFYSNHYLTSITLSNSITKVDNSAFLNCTNLASVDLGNSVTTLGEHVFGSCESLASIDLGNGIETIGNGAFQYCIGLTSITIPDTVISIGLETFKECTNLTTIYYSGSATGAPWGAPNATVVAE